MRTVIETIKTDVYKFDELSDEAKERFIDEQRESEAEITLDEVVDCMKDAMEKMGISIKDYSIDVNGSGYIDLDDDNDELEGIRAYKYIVNNFFDGANKKKVVYKDLGKRCTSRISHLERKDWMDNCPFSGWCYDFAVKDAWDNWCNELREGLEPSVRDFLDELGDAYLNLVASEYDGFDEECAREIAESNDFEFLEDGTVY